MSIQFAPTWNNASVAQTCIRANVTNTLSAASSTLIDLSVNNVSQFSVDKTGIASATSYSFKNPNLGIYNNSHYTMNFFTGGAVTAQISSIGTTIVVGSAGSFGFATALGTGSSSTDVTLCRDAAGVLAQRTSTNSQVFRVYNTYTDTSNLERIALQFTTYSSARYAQLAAESAGTGIANINLVLTPKGTGALIAGPMPDGTATGGNARGANAIDLQTSRTAATQVASGPNAVAVGMNSTASSTNGVAIGNTAVSTGGGNGRSIAIGNGATASSEYAIAIGTCTASGTGAMCISTELGSASGAGATVIGPAQATASGGCSIAIGGTASASRTNEVAFGFRHSLFDVRPGAFLLSCKTTDANFTALAGNNVFQSNIAWTTRSGTVIQGILQVLGIKSDGSAMASYVRKVIFKNVGGTITLVQSEIIGTDYEDNADTDIEITNATPFFRVKGIASETWRWAGWFGPTLEMGYGT